MFDVASGARDFRLPELFCGFQRDGIQCDRRLPGRVHPAGMGRRRAVHAAPGDARHLRARAEEPSDGRPAAAPGLARERRDSRHSRRQLEGEPCVSPDRTRHTGSRCSSSRATCASRCRHDFSGGSRESGTCRCPLPRHAALRGDRVRLGRHRGTRPPRRRDPHARPRRGRLRSRARAGGRERVRLWATSTASWPRVLPVPARSCWPLNRGSEVFASIVTGRSSSTGGRRALRRTRPCRVRRS